MKIIQIRSFFWLLSSIIQTRSEIYGVFVFGPNLRKYGPEKTRNSFHTVYCGQLFLKTKTTRLLHTLNRMSIGSPDAAVKKCLSGKLSLASGPIAQIACWFCERSSMYNSLPFGVITFLLKLQNTWPLWYDLCNSLVPATRPLLLNNGRSRPHALKLVTFTLFSFL